MNRKKLEKEFWLKYFKIPYNKLDSINPDVKRINFREEDIGDEDIYWLTTRIKSIGQLDLDYTSITDVGIKHLAKLETIKELRLKGCNITDDCLPDLGKLHTLELLHLGNTLIELDDITLLSSLQNLKLLLLSSSEDEEKIVEKAIGLKILLPGCEIIINHKSYD